MTIDGDGVEASNSLVEKQASMVDSLLEKLNSKSRGEILKGDYSAAQVQMIIDARLDASRKADALLDVLYALSVIVTDH